MFLFCFYNGILGNEGNHFLQYSRSGKTDFWFCGYILQSFKQSCLKEG